MTEYKHNKPHFKLKFSEFDEDEAQVLSFQGEEEISGLFEYRINLLSENPSLDFSKILNKKAILTILRGDDDPVKINGIIIQFEQRGRTPDYVSYYAVLVPKIWRLKLIYRNEIYHDMNLEDLLNTIFNDEGYSGQDYKINLKKNYSKSEFIVQYKESDLDFISRKLEHFGIHYFFNFNDDNEVLTIADSNDEFKGLELSDEIPFNPNGDPFNERATITEFTCREKIVTGSVKLKDYNYLFPEKGLISQSKKNSQMPGMYYGFGENYSDEKDGDMLAGIRDEQFLVQSKIFSGVSDCRLFHAGTKFKIEKHYRDDWNSDYIITKLKVQGHQRGLFGILQQSSRVFPTFENTFEAIPADVVFRSQRKTPVPKIHGIMSSVVETSSNDEYSSLDDHGRYKSKILFDMSDTTGGESSLPIRLLQSYSGAGYGIHFPNHVGSEMLLAFVDGDVERPVGLGTIPNPSNASPTTVNNKSQNVIRTAAGNEILMDDMTNEARVSVSTPDANNISLDDKDDKIEVTTKDKHKITMDDKNQNITVKSKDGHKVLMDDKNQKMDIVSKGEHFITIDDKNKSITVSDKDKKNTFVIDIGNKKIVIKTDEGNIDMQAPKGKIDIKAKELSIETEGDTKVKAANIQSEAKQDHKMKASGISMEAKMDLKAKGMNVSAEATSEFKAKGLNSSLEGSVKSEVKGAMADLKASGIATIQGSLVKIN